MTAIVPVSRVPIPIRPAVAGDYPFIDRLQSIGQRAADGGVNDRSGAGGSPV